MNWFGTTLKLNLRWNPTKVLVRRNWRSYNYCARPGYKPTFGTPAMIREKKPRTNHWMYQGYRADGNENTYSNLSRVVVRWHTRAKSGLSTKKKKEGQDDWLVVKLSREKGWQPPEDMPIRNTSRITQNKCQSNPISLEVPIGYQNNFFLNQSTWHTFPRQH